MTTKTSKTSNALARKRSEAAKKAWRTRRANAKSKMRSSR
jgi:hypothetical protein